MKAKLERVLAWVMLYGIGFLLGIIFLALRLIRIIRVLHWERFPQGQGKLILVANHPSLLEPVLLPLLFFRQYLFNPLKFIPWNTPDRYNFYDRRYYWCLRLRSVPIERKEPSLLRNKQAFRQMVKILERGEIIILFPEGGRTLKGKEAGEKFSYSKTGKRIRELKEGVTALAIRSGALVVPVWVEIKIRPIIKVLIKIGKPFKFSRLRVRLTGRKLATQKLARILLDLADEDG